MATIVEDLLSNRDTLLPWFTRDDLGRSYAPGKWTGHELLIHLADAEVVLLDRVRRLAADRKPLLWAFDQDDWVVALDYKRRSLATAATLFSATRNAIIELAEGFDSTALARGGVHSERGRMTLADALTGVVKHNRHHLGQIQAIAEGRTWDPSQAIRYG